MLANNFGSFLQTFIEIEPVSDSTDFFLKCGADQKCANLVGCRINVHSQNRSIQPKTSPHQFEKLWGALTLSTSMYQTPIEVSQ